MDCEGVLPRARGQVMTTEGPKELFLMPNFNFAILKAITWYSGCVLLVDDRS